MHLADGRFRAVGHQDQAVGEVQRFVDVVRHHHDDQLRLLPHAQQRVLQLEARQRVELRERLVEQEEPRLDATARAPARRIAACRARACAGS